MVNPQNASLVISNAKDLAGQQISLCLEDGIIAEISRNALPTTKDSFDARGATVLPALWDHHTHLRATAAWSQSLDVTAIHFEADFVASLRTYVDENDRNPWSRVVGYNDTTLGDLSAQRLDRLVPTTRPIRVQHRSGHAWVLNGAGCELLQRATGVPIPASGILYDQDSLFSALPRTGDQSPALRQIARSYLRDGVLGATEMTPTTDGAAAQNLSASIHRDFSLEFFGRPYQGFGLYGGGTKLVIEEHNLPGTDGLGQQLAALRPDPVAIHSVSVESLLLAMAALQCAPNGADRIEHALLAPIDYPRIAAAHFAGRNNMPAIGTNPGFIWSHGDRLLNDLSPGEIDDYQRLRSWKDAGFTLYGGTDSPYGPASVWQCMESAVRRRTRGGKSLGKDESLLPEEAISLFTRRGLMAQGPELSLHGGEVADLCFVEQSFGVLIEQLSQAKVTAVIAQGRLVHEQ